MQRKTVKPACIYSIVLNYKNDKNEAVGIAIYKIKTQIISIAFFMDFYFVNLNGQSLFFYTDQITFDAQL